MVTHENFIFDNILPSFLHFPLTSKYFALFLRCNDPPPIDLLECRENHSDLDKVQRFASSNATVVFPRRLDGISVRLSRRKASDFDLTVASHL